jgi:hypothetical protein
MGFRLQHLLTIMSPKYDPLGNMQQAFFQLLNFIAEGKPCLAARQALTSVAITPILKDASWQLSGIRPIAVGLLVTKIISKAFLRKYAQQLQDVFRPLGQYGVSTKAGCELIIHETRRLIQQGTAAAYKIDLVNAYGNISRRAIALQLQCRLGFSDMLRWFHFAYDQPVQLSMFGRHLTHSTTGVLQGDPLAPALFSLGMIPLLQALKQSSGHSLWYLDDGIVIGQNADAQRLFNVIQTQAPMLGLSVNLEKSEFIPPQDTDQAVTAVAIRTTSREQLQLLGASLGNSDHARAHLRTKLQSVQIGLKRLLELGHSQIAFHLLRYSFSLPNFTYILRCTPPQLFGSMAAEVDDIIQQAFYNITTLQCVVIITQSDEI